MKTIERVSTMAHVVTPTSGAIFEGYCDHQSFSQDRAMCGWLLDNLADGESASVFWEYERADWDDVTDKYTRTGNGFIVTYA